MQQSAAWFQANAIPVWELNGKVLPRAGAFRAGTSKDNVAQRQVWACRDGYVFFNILGGKTGAKTLRGLTQWLNEEGLATEFLLTMDWDHFDMFTVTREVMAQISEPIGRFFLRHTRKELLKGAVPRMVSIGPLFSMQDLLEDESLHTRKFWTRIEHPELNTAITYPRQFVHSTEKDLYTRFRAPLIGEHNEAVYSAIGLSKQELAALKQAGII
jgi:crotonobetainyl-CoA:carnitine CoA-transferase CaiB-like acyl-CoA transferase